MLKKTLFMAGATVLSMQSFASYETENKYECFDNSGILKAKIYHQVEMTDQALLNQDQFFEINPQDLLTQQKNNAKKRTLIETYDYNGLVQYEFMTERNDLPFFDFTYEKRFNYGMIQNVHNFMPENSVGLNSVKINGVEVNNFRIFINKDTNSLIQAKLTVENDGHSQTNTVPQSLDYTLSFFKVTDPQKAIESMRIDCDLQ